jgi:hypothetical protein
MEKVRRKTKTKRSERQDGKWGKIQVKLRLEFSIQHTQRLSGKQLPHQSHNNIQFADIPKRQEIENSFQFEVCDE